MDNPSFGIYYNLVYQAIRVPPKPENSRLARFATFGKLLLPCECGSGLMEFPQVGVKLQPDGNSSRTVCGRSMMFWPFRRREVPARPAPLDAAAIVRRARRLRFRVRPGAVSQLAGAYHGARPGIGLTFAELRAYEPGDDVRHLDWNVTARQGRPFVRRFVEERALSLWLVVDVSASMRFGPERATKADRAAQAAALLATAAIQNGDRAGLALVSDRIERELAPAGGVRHLSQLVRALVATPTTSPKTRLSVGLARVRRTARRAMIVVISDFRTEEPVGTWRRAARRHDTIALRIVDPRENQLPARRPALARGCRGRIEAHGRFELSPCPEKLREGRRAVVDDLSTLVRQFGHSRIHDVD